MSAAPTDILADHGEGWHEERRCSISKCDGRHVARGLCRKHYYRWKRHGDAEPGNTRHRSANTLKRDLLARVVIDTDTKCHVWQGAGLDHGYGVVGANGRQWLAHRLAYTLFRGSIPDGLHIDHLCRNRRCINPAHLEAVTPAENLQRSRDHHGLKTYCARGHKLTDGNLLIEKSGARRCRTCRQSWLSNRRNKRDA